MLAITYFGGLTRGKKAYVIYGDGKCELRKSNNPDGQREPRELFLSYEETREIVKIAVDHGLVGISVDELLQKMGRSGGEASMHVGAEDLGDMLFELELISYQKNGQELGPIATRLVLHGPALLWSTHPDVPELQGLAELAERMEGLAARAIEISPSDGGSHDENDD
ncbi:MAG: hypothetical protein HC897_03825 [Thermoanaerobaculia bacterium]|nr:hypothetical protein [Thermoanaerobaculia bacterium]